MTKAETQGHIEVLNEIKSKYAADCDDCGNDCGDCDDKSVCFDFSAIRALNVAIKALEHEQEEEKLKWQCSKCGSRYPLPWAECPSCKAEME